MNSSILQEIIDETAVSLRRSLDIYWPADEHGKNDAAERNLSFHFANRLLSRDFFVFAEANHPNKIIQGIDTLAISADRSFCMACEFKNYVGPNMERSMNDLDRVATFELNRKFKRERIGEMRFETLNICNRKVGLVAGLTWVGGEREIDLKRSPGQKRFEEKLQSMGGHLLKPVVVRWSRTDKVKGAYYILSACLGDIK